MGEMRQNKVTGQWTIYAPDRAKRPRNFARTIRADRATLSFDPDCPFCPGNEPMMDSLILELPDGNGDWQTRVAPNKYPVLTPDPGMVTSDSGHGAYLTRPGHGRHEVIIESPRHDGDLAFVPVEAVCAVIETYHHRYVDLSREHGLMMTFIFRNHGPEAGTSLAHPHSQLISAPVVAPQVRWRQDAARQYFDDWGRCGYCDMLKIEEQQGQRVILENGSFVVFVPFAAVVPFEMWIVPRRHQSDFGAIVDSEKADLAAGLQGALHRLALKANDPDYNYMIHTAANGQGHVAHLHWYLQILPRWGCEAGFEAGSGMGVNVSTPEEDALILR